jgi:hypothetical protein
MKEREKKKTVADSKPETGQKHALSSQVGIVESISPPP